MPTAHTQMDADHRDNTVTEGTFMRAMCTAGDRCSCADNNWQWRDATCAAVELHARRLAAKVIPLDLSEAATMARARLEAFADDANAGRVHYSARELKRKVWAAFAEFDALTKQRVGESQ